MGVAVITAGPIGFAFALVFVHQHSCTCDPLVHSGTVEQSNNPKAIPRYFDTIVLCGARGMNLVVAWVGGTTSNDTTNAFTCSLESSGRASIL